MIRMAEKLTLCLAFLAFAAVSVSSLAISAAPAEAGTTRTTETDTCISMVTKHQNVNAASISACEHSSLKVLHVCPKGLRTVFVVIHGRTYGYRLHSHPILLAKQYGMGAISHTCGYQKG